MNCLKDIWTADLKCINSVIEQHGQINYSEDLFLGRLMVCKIFKEHGLFDELDLHIYGHPLFRQNMKSYSTSSCKDLNYFLSGMEYDLNDYLKIKEEYNVVKDTCIENTLPITHLDKNTYYILVNFNDDKLISIEYLGNFLEYMTKHRWYKYPNLIFSNSSKLYEDGHLRILHRANRYVLYGKSI